MLRNHKNIHLGIIIGQLVLTLPFIEFDIDCVMINRVLIRLKVIQVVYAYYLSGSHKVETAERELSVSLSKAYELYNILLYLLVESLLFVRQRVNRKLRFSTEPVTKAETRFMENRFLAQLEINESLTEYIKTENMEWLTTSVFPKRFSELIMESEVFNEYMEAGVFTYNADKELCKKLYKNLLVDNEELDALLEERSLYWNGDKAEVDSFVIRTIKNFKEGNGATQPLLPEFKSHNDVVFAETLLRTAIENCDEYRSLISESSKHWDANRLALMDVIIMQIAIAEIVTFESIPIKVTINEYVELAKYYSTPKSGGFVNGMLDAIATKMYNDGVITKHI